MCVVCGRARPRARLTFERSTSVLAWSLSFLCSIFTLRNLQTDAHTLNTHAWKIKKNPKKRFNLFNTQRPVQRANPSGCREQAWGAVTLPSLASFSTRSVSHTESTQCSKSVHSKVPYYARFQIFNFQWSSLAWIIIPPNSTDHQKTVYLAKDV